MEIRFCERAPFSVIGREGSTDDGEGFISRLWTAANEHFGEIADLVRMKDGVPAGLWGLMTDFSRAFRPWEDGYSRGLYLAGAECRDDAEPPAGWVKWTSPGYRFACCPMTGPESFGEGLTELEKRGYSLAGAAYDFTQLPEGNSYVYFPIGKR